MRKKLTITVDEDLIPAAKRYARSRGLPLSSVIEQSLRQVTHQQAPAFSSKWRGKFRPAERDDPRFQALAAKYLD